MNIMLVSVTAADARDRRAEGPRRLPPRHRRQFLTEAVTLSTFGGSSASSWASVSALVRALPRAAGGDPRVVRPRGPARLDGRRHLLRRLSRGEGLAARSDRIAAVRVGGEAVLEAYSDKIGRYSMSLTSGHAARPVPGPGPVGGRGHGRRLPHRGTRGWSTRSRSRSSRIIPRRGSQRIVAVRARGEGGGGAVASQYPGHPRLRPGGASRKAGSAVMDS